jgi:hypothetical protein
MATDRTVTATAADGFKRMTLGELEDFIAEMHEAGAARTTPIHARVTFGGWLRELKATAIRFGDPDA